MCGGVLGRLYERKRSCIDTTFLRIRRVFVTEMSCLIEWAHVFMHGCGRMQQYFESTIFFFYKIYQNCVKEFPFRSLVARFEVRCAIGTNTGKI